MKDLKACPQAVLTAAQLQLAAELEALWQQRRRERHLTTHYEHAGDQGGEMRNSRGAIGEVGFRVTTHRPLPTATEMASTFKLPDCDGYAIKATGSVNGNLLLRPEDLASTKHHSYALMLVRSPEVWLLGVIKRERAHQLKVWGTRESHGLPFASWLVEQDHLVPYQWPPMAPITAEDIWPTRSRTTSR